MADLKQLIKERGIVKAKLTRFKNYFDALSGSEDLTQLKIRLSKLEQCWEEFDAIQRQIELQDECSDHEVEREYFESQYFELTTAAQNFISERDNPRVEHRVKAHNQSLFVKLPDINLPTFSGCYDEWVSFHNTFLTVIHENTNISDVHKFHYLKCSLKGEAANLLLSLESSPENYKIAWQLLNERYGNKRYLITKHIKSLFSLNKIVKESSSSLRKLLDNTLKHLRALSALGQPTEQWDTLIIYLVTTHLDAITLREWECLVDSNTLPTMSDLIHFLQNKCQVLEAIESSKLANHQENQITINDKNLKFKRVSSPKGQFHTYNHVASTKKCKLCESSHAIFNCSKFNGLSIPDRVKEVKRLQLCFNCLGDNHKTKQCKSSFCKICSKAHNTLLHYTQTKFDNKYELPNNSLGCQQLETTQQAVLSASSLKVERTNQTQVVLSTAIIVVFDAGGASHLCRVLLDSGSQSNFITENLAQLLGLKRNIIQSGISGIGQSSARATHSIRCKIKSRLSNFHTTLDFIILPKITQQLPTAPINTAKFKVPINMELADPSFHTPSTIDMLIGAEIFFNVLTEGTIKGAEDTPVLQNTQWGWIVSGKYKPKPHFPQPVTCHITTEDKIDTQLQLFWQLEECSIKSAPSSEAKACEEHFKGTFTRDENGCFIVKLPLRTNADVLGDSREIAIPRFLQQERNFTKDPARKEGYMQFMKEYEDLGHMKQVPANEAEKENSHTFYLPHHCVVNNLSTTTKLRVVFDGSCKSTNGTSLNDILMVGPTVQEELFSILVRFRKHQFVMTADIEKMYRQINIHASDTDLQRIVWRYSPEEPLKTYCLTTVTYGTSSAPFLATRCLQQLAIEEERDFPKASAIAQTDFYVDDLLTGTSSISEGLELQHQLISMLRRGGFKLRKWCSNNPHLLKQIPEESRQKGYIICTNETKTVKTLGVTWDPTLDKFSFSIKHIDSNPNISKRQILSVIASLFDPLGLIGPVILKAKILMQHLWELNIGWDETLPSSLQVMWSEYCKELAELENLSIPRQICTTAHRDIQIHGFCDASQTAYGACIYIRSHSNDGKTCVRLVCSKSRVAPIKKITLPRLELCAAVLLSRLIYKVITALRDEFSRCVLWSDSTVRLSWIKSSSAQWKTFVANRVAEIHELTTKYEWRHVSSKDNPADYVSRGLSSSQIIDNCLWWSGPSWLRKSEVAWPCDSFIDTNQSLERCKKPVVLIAAEKSHIFMKYSTLTKLQRVTAYCLRFIKNCATPVNSRKSGPLSAHELKSAMDLWIRVVQHEAFSSEIHDLQTNHQVNSKSTIRSLSPFLDENHILRVGGRLTNARVYYNQKHPILLPAKHHITQLIMQHEHVKQLHAGPQLLLACVRRRFWPLNGRNLARQMVHQCITCFKANPSTSSQLMGNLPSARVKPNRPFLTCGIDYCGPIYIRTSHRRGNTPIKAYIAVFVCFVTKSIHLELVGNLTTESFLGALKRFIARRGKCENIYSDNATNFVGANHELNELRKLFMSTTHQEELASFLAEDNITWHFIPPRSPHFGGLWEAAVKSLKYHLKRVVGNSVFTYEEMYTYLTLVEACLNSRPLTPLSSDPNDLSPLTPGHFLIGDALTAPVEPDLQELPSNKLSRWQLVQQRLQHFWSRWSTEYISGLQQRVKWTTNVPSLQPGDLVIVKEDNLPPLKWSLARILSLHPGQDGLSRVATIKTISGVTKRAINKLCPLPKET